MTRQTNTASGGPIGWLFKLLALIGRFVYYFVRILLWILRRLKPGR